MTRRSPKPVRGWTRVPDYSLVDTGATVRDPTYWWDTLPAEILPAPSRKCTGRRPPASCLSNPIRATLNRKPCRMKITQAMHGALPNCSGAATPLQPGGHCRPLPHTRIGRAPQRFFFRGLPEPEFSPELNAALLKIAQYKVALYDAALSEWEQMPWTEAWLQHHNQSLGSRPIRVLTTGNHAGHFRPAPNAHDPKRSSLVPSMFTTPLCQCGVNMLRTVACDSTWLALPLAESANSMASRARSDGVLHKPPAAISGLLCHLPVTGDPFARVPDAAEGARSAGRGCA